MSFEVGDCKTGVSGLLMNRPFADSVFCEAARKAVLEFTENYKHPLLEVNGPNTNLVAYQNLYAPGFFTGEADTALDVSKVNSFFIYNNYNGAPSPTNFTTNTGYDLKYRSPDSIEVLLNIPGLPVYWSRSNNQILIASMPDSAYTVYMRFQTQHPSSDTVGGFTDSTVVQMADSWQEILEYAIAIRLAPQLNLANKKNELHTSLYGDSKFQTSSGAEGAPGLIFQRTSQFSRDQNTTTRRLRLRMGRV